jgi:hypothetical protein
MAMRTIVSPGYIRKIRVGGKLITQHLLDQKFKVCDKCGHWERSGAAARCRIAGTGLPCPCHHKNPTTE